MICQVPDIRQLDIHQSMEIRRSEIFMDCHDHPCICVAVAYIAVVCKHLIVVKQWNTARLLVAWCIDIVQQMLKLPITLLSCSSE